MRTKEPVVPASNASLRFSSCNAFTLGLEEELLMVASGSLRPRAGTDAVLAAIKPDVGSVAGEVSDGVLELITPVCATVGESVGIIEDLRDDVGRRVGLLGAGVHPRGRFGDVKLRNGARYDVIGDTMRDVMRQTPHCGVHVHVGMPDGDSAIRACNGMRAWLPLLQALSANSPYWYGRDSGFASARSVICNSFPRAGIPREFEDYADFAMTAEDLRALGECPDYSFLWWDVRPHPRLGTLEIRILDAQSSLEDLAGLVALVHCLSVHEATSRPHRGPSAEVLRELSFRAARDGLDAQLLRENGLRPARELACEAIALAACYASDLGCWDELMLVHRLLEHGNGAERQRRHERAGGLGLVLRRLAEETAERFRLAQPLGDTEAHGGLDMAA
jgi:glutamate---cysteine ligase / carboxylate-amine ligase